MNTRTAEMLPLCTSLNLQREPAKRGILPTCALALHAGTRLLKRKLDQVLQRTVNSNTKPACCILDKLLGIYIGTCRIFCKARLL